MRDRLAACATGRRCHNELLTSAAAALRLTARAETPASRPRGGSEALWRSASVWGGGRMAWRGSKRAAAGALALAIGWAGAAEAASPAAAVRAWRQAHEKQILADFTALLAMPNVATTVSDVEKNAAYIQTLLEKRGFRTRL